jgi:hypothetical protein
MNEERPMQAADQVTPERADDSDIGWGEVIDDDPARQAWLLEQRPPHWG